MDTIFFDNFNGSFNIVLLYRQRCVQADVMPKNVVVDVKPLRMLLSVIADVIAMMSLWQMLKLLTVATYYYMADVIANVADGIATAGWVLLW